MGGGYSTQCLKDYAMKHNGTAVIHNDQIQNALINCKAKPNENNEHFLGITQSNDHSSICLNYTTIFGIIIIIVILILIFKPKSLGITQ